MDADRGPRDEIAHGGSVGRDGHGDDEPWPADGLRDRWRRPVALAVAVCVGLALGGYGVRAWYEDQRRNEVRFHASLFASVTSGDGAYATLRLRNLGRRPITIEKARLDLTGFAERWIGLDEPRTIRSGAAVDIAYELAMDCQRKPPQAGTADLRVRPAGEDPRWVEVVVPLPPSDALGGLVSAHSRLCGGSTPPRVKIETLGVRQSSDDDIVLRVRMTVFTVDGSQPPEDLRLTTISTVFPRLRVSFSPLDGGRSVRLPVEGDLRINLIRCGRVSDTIPGFPFFLRVDLASEQTPLDAASVSPDLEYAHAMLDYVAERCGD